MFEADISQATVPALFLLPDNLRKLTPKFMSPRPGTRIVANSFGVDGWKPDRTERLGGECTSWCTAVLYIVPARIAGTWHHAHGELRFEQTFQVLEGTREYGGIKSPIENARLRGERIEFTVAGVHHSPCLT
jgi:hypothetical protein